MAGYQSPSAKRIAGIMKVGSTSHHASKLKISHPCDCDSPRASSVLGMVSDRRGAFSQELDSSYGFLEVSASAAKSQASKIDEVVRKSEEQINRHAPPPSPLSLIFSPRPAGTRATSWHAHANHFIPPQTSRSVTPTSPSLFPALTSQLRRERPSPPPLALTLLLPLARRLMDRVNSRSPAAFPSPSKTSITSPFRRAAAAAATSFTGSHNLSNAGRSAGGDENAVANTASDSPKKVRSSPS